jgi:hypothetical protein
MAVRALLLSIRHDYGGECSLPTLHKIRCISVTWPYSQNVTVKHTATGRIGARGFEPPTSWSQTTRSTKLSYAP